MRKDKFFAEKIKTPRKEAIKRISARAELFFNRNRRRHKKADGQQNKEPRNDAQSAEKAQVNQSAKESGEEAKSKHHRNRNRNRRRRPAGGENRDAQTKNQTKPQN